MKQCFEYKVVKIPEGFTVEIQFLGKPYPLEVDAMINATTMFALDIKMENFIQQEAEQVMLDLRGGYSNGFANHLIKAMQKYSMELASK